MSILQELKSIFVCQHTRYNFPQTDRETGHTTVRCSDCGKRFAYSWERMERGAEVSEGTLIPCPITAAREGQQSFWRSMWERGKTTMPVHNVLATRASATDSGDGYADLDYHDHAHDLGRRAR